MGVMYGKSLGVSLSYLFVKDFLEIPIPVPEQREQIGEPEVD